MKSDRSVVREEFARIKRVFGEVSVDIVLKEAKKKTNPLHSRFDWDDSIAANKWRREQAQQLIRAEFMVMVVQQQSAPITVRAYLPMEGGESRYLPRVEALSQKETRELFIQRQLSVLRNWCDETSDIEEFHSLRAVVTNELERLKPRTIEKVEFTEASVTPNGIEMGGYSG